MLVLTRCRNQAIVIGCGDVQLRIISVNKQGEVKIGIEANMEIPVHREEIYKKIKRMQKKAASTVKYSV